MLHQLRSGHDQPLPLQLRESRALLLRRQYQLTQTGPHASTLAGTPLASASPASRRGEPRTDFIRRNARAVNALSKVMMAIPSPAEVDRPTHRSAPIVPSRYALKGPELRPKVRQSNPNTSADSLACPTSNINRRRRGSGQDRLGVSSNHQLAHRIRSLRRVDTLGELELALQLELTQHSTAEQMEVETVDTHNDVRAEFEVYEKPLACLSDSDIVGDCSTGPTTPRSMGIDNKLEATGSTTDGLTLPDNQHNGPALKSEPTELSHRRFRRPSGSSVPSPRPGSNPDRVGACELIHQSYLQPSESGEAQGEARSHGGGASLTEESLKQVRPIPSNSSGASASSTASFNQQSAHHNLCLCTAACECIGRRPASPPQANEVLCDVKSEHPTKARHPTLSGSSARSETTLHNDGSPPLTPVSQPPAPSHHLSQSGAVATLPNHLHSATVKRALHNAQRSLNANRTARLNPRNSLRHPALDGHCSASSEPSGGRCECECGCKQRCRDCHVHPAVRSCSKVIGVGPGGHRKVAIPQRGRP